MKIKFILGWDVDDSWDDLICSQNNYDRRGCVGCTFPHTFKKNNILILRGLCWNSGFDTQFMIRNNDETGKIMSYSNCRYQVFDFTIGMVEYIGFKHTTLQYDFTLYQWNMTVANNPDILGVSHTTMQSLLIGVHEWEIFGDINCNSRPYKVKLALREA